MTAWGQTPERHENVIATSQSVGIVASMSADLTGLVWEELAGPRRWLRIAVVTETFPPEVNGVALTAARFVDGLRAAGHRIQLVRPRQAADAPDRQAPSSEQLLVRGIGIPRYPSLKMGLPVSRSLLRLWSGCRPDVVHIVTEGPLGWSALRAAERLRLPVVSDFRTNFDAYSAHYGMGWLARPIRAYLRSFHNRGFATLVPTEALRNQLSCSGFRGLRVVARGIDTTLFDPKRRSEGLRERWGANASDPVFVIAGRLAPEKNLSLAVAAYECARRSFAGARLVVIGDGPDRAALMERVPEAHFTGTLTGETLAAYLASADVFLFPSLTETWGNVTLEAMASGLAVIAFDYAAAGEVIVPGRNGMLAPFGDPQSFVRLAFELASSSGRIRSLGMAARASALGRGWPAVVTQLEAVLLAAADRCARPATVPAISTLAIR